MFDLDVESRQKEDRAMTRNDDSIRGLAIEVEKVQAVIRKEIMPRYHEFWVRLWFGWFVPL